MPTSLPRVAELRQLTDEELHGKRATAQQALWQDAMKAKTGALAHTHQLRMVRRHLARIATILNERRALQKGSPS